MTPTTLRLDRLETRLAPAVATWDGGGPDNNWTTAANWVGDVAPQPGDDLVFPQGAARLTSKALTRSAPRLVSWLVSPPPNLSAAQSPFRSCRPPRIERGSDRPRRQHDSAT